MLERPRARSLDRSLAGKAVSEITAGATRAVLTLDLRPAVHIAISARNQTANCSRAGARPIKKPPGVRVAPDLPDPGGGRNARAPVCGLSTARSQGKPSRKSSLEGKDVSRGTHCRSGFHATSPSRAGSKVRFGSPARRPEVEVRWNRHEPLPGCIDCLLKWPSPSAPVTPRGDRATRTAAAARPSLRRTQPRLVDHGRSRGQGLRSKRSAHPKGT